MFPAHVNFVGARSTIHQNFRIGVGTEDRDFVVAIRTVDKNSLDVIERHESACPGDIFAGYHKYIRNWSTIDNKCVDSRSAIDDDIRALQISVKRSLAVVVGIGFDIKRVCSFSANQLPTLRPVFGIVQYGRIDQVGIQHEQVVARFTSQFNFGRVVMNVECVVPAAAVNDGATAYTRRCIWKIDNRNTVRRSRQEGDRSNRERVFTRPQTDRRIGPIVI